MLKRKWYIGQASNNYIDICINNVTKDSNEKKILYTYIQKKLAYQLNPYYIIDIIFYEILRVVQIIYSSILFILSLSNYYELIQIPNVRWKSE